MICPTCQGEGYVRGWDPENAGALVMLPCLECNGSGVVSCCDAAGSRALAANETPSRDRQAALPLTDETPLVFPRLADAYRDDTYPERPCDHCGKLYRGPAVYCSLECAVADA